MKGFAENRDGKVCAVLVQPFIADARLATKAEIHDEFLRLGFHPEDHGEYYTNGQYDIFDATAQIKWDIVEEESTTSILPSMQTDIMLSIGERTLIIDTKYYSHTLQSNYNKKTRHSTNLYQIFAYVRNCDSGNTGKVDGMLLYAKTDDDPVLNDKEILSGGNVIYFRTFDLNRDFKEIANQLDSILKL